MGAAEVEGQAAEEGDRELRRGTAEEDEAGGRDGQSGRSPENIAVDLPPPWLFGQGVDIFPKVQCTTNAF